MARKPFFRRDPLTSIIATLGVFFLSQLVAVIIISLYPLLRDWTEEQATGWLVSSVAAQFFYILFAEIAAIFMVRSLVSWAGVTWARIGLIKPKIWDLFYAIVAYCLYFISLIVVITLASWLVPALNVDQEQQVGFKSAYGSLALAMTFISLVVLPPIAEEIIFRGFLFTSLRAKFRLHYAIIITSILFGLAHLQFGAGAPLLWAAAIDTFVLSVFLCLLRERSGSLWPPIILHAIKNLVAFVALFGNRIF